MAVSLILLSLSGCGGNGGANGSSDGASSGEDTLRLAVKADITTMDVHKTSNDYLVPMNVFDTLFTIKKSGDGSSKIESSLAEKYEVTADGMTYEFTLRDGVVFSDGTPLTSRDVKFTFERILTLPDSAQADYIIPIAGAQEMLDKKADSLSGFTVEDDAHFTITMTEPFAGFIASLATPSTSIFSEKIVTEAGDDFGVVPEKTIGTGPYIIKEWTRGSRLVFDSNPRYWGKEPSVKHVEVSIMEPQVMNTSFQKGDIDILDCLMLDSAIVNSTYKSDTYKDRLISVDRLGQNFLILNEKIEPLQNVEVRKAIQQAIDREYILASIFDGDGKIEDGILTTGCIGYCEDNQGWLKYDPENAKTLLADAGYADGFSMDLYLDSSSADSIKNAIQVISRNLADVGITARITSMDHESYLDLRKSGDMSAYWALWLLDYNDPGNIMYTFFGSADNTKARSDNYYNNDVISKVGSAKSIINENKRFNLYGSLEKQIVKEDAAVVPMFSLKHLFVISDRIDRFDPHWAGWSDIYFSQVVLK